MPPEEISLTDLDILEEVENEDGSFTTVFGTDDGPVPEEAFDHDTNLVPYLDEAMLAEISGFCDARFESDLQSNDEFFKFIQQQIPRLGLKIERVEEPFPGASPVVHPLVLESAVKMTSKVIGEVFSGKSFVDAYVRDPANPEVGARANAVREFMNWQYKVQMPEYFSETEQLAFRTFLTGNTFRKYGYDILNQRPKAYFLTEDRFIINTTAKTIYDADFHTEIITMPRHVFQGLVRAGHFADIDVSPEPATPTDTERAIKDETGDPQGFRDGDDTFSDYELHEHHCYWEMPEEIVGEASLLPYIVTRDSRSHKVLSIRRNWKETDPLRRKRNWYAHYKMLPGLGFYGLGYIHLLGNFQFSLTQMTRSLLDAGQFANLQGGFRAKGVRIVKDTSMPIAMGEFREVDTGQRPISEVIYPLNFKEPSQVLSQLLQFLDGRAQKFADATEQVIADSTNYGPVGTTVALLEASTKFMTGILKRFYAALGDEFRILYDLDYDTLDEQMQVVVKGQALKVRREFFDGSVDVTPAADPNMNSNAHRLSISNAKLEAALKAPQIHNLTEAYRDFYTNLGLEPEEIAALLPSPQEAQPADPLSDVQAAAMGKPIKAFPGQDHDAHIAVKTNFINDAQGGKSPALQKIVPLLEANIAEHQLLKYVERAQALMGAVDPKMQSMISQEAAQSAATEALRSLNQIEVNQKSLAAGDPAMLIAAAELKTAEARSKEVDIKAETSVKKIELETDKLELERLKLAQKDDIDRQNIRKDIIKQNKEQGFEIAKTALADIMGQSE